MNQTDKMFNHCSGLGSNPFSVNVITYSGHGITYNDDAIAVIPEFSSQDQGDSVEVKDMRFINMSGLARKFASIDHSINIFIMSMCRVHIDKDIKILE